jgi:hypothetical protein
MSNNITLSTEDIGSGVQLNRSKIVIGVSGTDSGDISSSNPLPVDGSAVTQPISGSVSVSNFPATQPVSGTITANAGTNLNTSALALESGGNLSTIASTVSSSKVNVAGTITANAGSGNFTVIQSTASNLLSSVGGLGASGSAVSGNPVIVAGSDGTNVRTLNTDNSGNLHVLCTKVTVANVGSQTVTSSSHGDSFNVDGLRYLLIGINVTGTSGGNTTIVLQGEGPDSNWYKLGNNYPDAPLTITGNGNFTFAVGPGCFGYAGAGINVTPNLGTVFPSNIRIFWNVPGSASLTFAYWIVGNS